MSLQRCSIVAAALVTVAGAASAVFAQAVFAQDEAPAFPPARVEIATAELRNMAPQVDVPGTVVSLNDSRIAAEVEGVLTWLAEVGDAVNEGQVIARINPRLMDVALRRARANVAQLEAELAFREANLKRNEDLAATSHGSAHLLDEARAQHDAVLQQLADARAQLERAEGDLARTEMRAAFAGHITQRLASVGEYVAAGDDVVRLVDTHRIEIALPAPISLAPHITPGMEVWVRNGDTERKYPVRTVVPVGDAVSRMVEIRLSAAEGDWLVGTPVQVSLPSNTPKVAVAVPRDALVERGGQAYVYKVTEEGTAEQITATILSKVGLWVGIAEGVEPGDRVIVRGAERLMPGQAVEVQNAN